jgi:putative nucleotidyltransferase with HDIG domain
MNPAKPGMESFVNDAAKVYALPQLYERLNLVINHPRSSVADITRILSEDVGLSSRILKLANSPMFGYHSKIDSISSAVTVIGTRQLRDMALAVSVMGVFKGIPDKLINMASFWQHSITIAIIARILATCRREANVERYFVAGILHDIGELILCTQAPELVKKMAVISRESGDPHFAIQRSTLGFDHADLGGELLKLWRIPTNITDPVACHHDPEQAGNYPMEASIMHVADVIGHAMQVGFSGEQFVPPLNQHAWERLAIPTSMLPTILAQADSQLSDTLSILSGEASHG